MAQRKVVSDGKTQHQRFVEAARKHGASEDAADWNRALIGVAKAPGAKAKKTAKKPKGMRTR